MGYEHKVEYYLTINTDIKKIHTTKNQAVEKKRLNTLLIRCCSITVCLPCEMPLKFIRPYGTMPPEYFFSIVLDITQCHPGDDLHMARSFARFRCSYIEATLVCPRCC